jgi:pantothenate kinase
MMVKTNFKTFLDEEITVNRSCRQIYIQLSQLIITHSLARSTLFAEKTENSELTKDRTSLRLNLLIQITLNTMTPIIMLSMHINFL